MSKDLNKNPSIISLRETLTKERIKLNVKVDSWQEAVREAGNLLVYTGAATPKYIDAMIKTAEELGPYIVIDEGIAMPHASPSSGVLKTALSLVRLEQPIYFGNPDNDPVTIVFGLAATEGNLHIALMQSLAQLIMNKEKITEILNAPDSDAILEILN
jgi:mannitol/fructose-specific phosphotransferase system IIA component (Ntr-type)